MADGPRFESWRAYSETRSVAADLRPGGVYAQWFHNYETNRESTELVLNTYRQVFERVSIWNGKSDDLILLGFDDRVPVPDIDKLVRSLSRTGFQRAAKLRPDESEDSDPFVVCGSALVDGLPGDAEGKRLVGL
jgi:hypothetical protein